MSALGLLAHPLDFLALVKILQYMKLSSLLYTSRVYFFCHGWTRFRPLELEGVTPVVDCVKYVPIPVKKKTNKKKQDDPPPRVVKQPPLTRDSKIDDPPSLCSGPPPPPQIRFDQSVLHINVNTPGGTYRKRFCQH